MIYVSYDELNEMIANGRIAFDYAWEHYDELNSRQMVFRLYGPHSHRLGAACPCSTVKQRHRELRTKTRRKNHTIYELDEKYTPLRIIHFNHDRIDCTYHVFDLNGIRYACPFSRDEKHFYAADVLSLKFHNGRPIYYAELASNRVFGEFYEYISNDRVETTVYDYFPNCKISPFGEPVSFDAPYGARNSPIVLGHFEMPTPCIDFSKWFEQNP